MRHSRYITEDSHEKIMAITHRSNIIIQYTCTLIIIYHVIINCNINAYSYINLIQHIGSIVIGV